MKELILILLIILILYKFKEYFKEQFVSEELEEESNFKSNNIQIQEEESKIQNNIQIQEEESKINNFVTNKLDRERTKIFKGDIKKDIDKDSLKKLESEYNKLSDFIRYNLEGREKKIKSSNITKDSLILEEESKIIQEEENIETEEEVINIIKYPDIQDEEDYYVEGGYDSLFMNLKMPPNYFSFSERNIYLERAIAINLYNYLLNFSQDSPVNQRNNQISNLSTYLNKLKFIKNVFNVEMITDANQFINEIIKKLNLHFKKKFNNEINLTKEMLISDYKSKILDCYKNNFIDNIENNIIKESQFLSSFFFLNEVFYLISDEVIFFNEYKNVNFNNAAIEFLVNLNLIQNVTVLDYDNFDNILNAIDNYLKIYTFSTFNKRYDNIIYYKLSEVRNIFYSGKKEDFNFSFV